MKYRYHILEAAFTTSLLCGTLLCGPARAADYLVDLNYAGVDGAPHLRYAAAYRTINTALADTGVPAGASASDINRIYFAAGTYDTAITTGKTLSYAGSNVALIGMTGNPDDVVITSYLDAAYDLGSGRIGTTGSASLRLTGNNVSALGITFANSTDTPYMENVIHRAVTPAGTYTGNAQTDNAPAVALKLQGDKLAFKNCKFLGYQDTLFVNCGRAYFKDCYINGDIDFIFSRGTAVFKDSTINIGGDHPGGVITAASTDKNTSNGLVFLDCTITGNSVRGNPVIDPHNAANPNGASTNDIYLGRPWGWQQPGGDASTVFINTKMDDSIRAVGWRNWNPNQLNAGNNKNDGNPAKDTRYAEYNSMDLSGAVLDVSSRVAWSRQLTASQAADYTVAKLFSRESAFPWYGRGYSGSADPNDVSFSWPAFWGNRNSNNHNNSALINAVYPAPGNPSAYDNPRWLLTSDATWDPEAQLAAAGSERAP